MATFWEIAARSVRNLFSLYFVSLLHLFISRFGIKRGICLLIDQFLFIAFLLLFFLNDIWVEIELCIPLESESSVLSTGNASVCLSPPSKH